MATLAQLQLLSDAYNVPLARLQADPALVNQYLAKAQGTQLGVKLGTTANPQNQADGWIPTAVRTSDMVQPATPVNAYTPPLPLPSTAAKNALTTSAVPSATQNYFQQLAAGQVGQQIDPALQASFDAERMKTVGAPSGAGATPLANAPAYSGPVDPSTLPVATNPNLTSGVGLYDHITQTLANHPTLIPTTIPSGADVSSVASTLNHSNPMVSSGGNNGIISPSAQNLVLPAVAAGIAAPAIAGIVAPAAAPAVDLALPGISDIVAAGTAGGVAANGATNISQQNPDAGPPVVVQTPDGPTVLDSSGATNIAQQNVGGTPTVTQTPGGPVVVEGPSGGVNVNTTGGGTTPSPTTPVTTTGSGTVNPTAAAPPAAPSGTTTTTGTGTNTSGLPDWFTGAAALGGGALGAAATYFAGQQQADAAKAAAVTQQQGAQAAIDAQNAGLDKLLAQNKEQFTQQQTNAQPWLDTGKGALNDLWNANGNGLIQTYSPPTYNNFSFNTDPSAGQVDPSYSFRLDEGLKALQNSAAARGGLLSGNTGKALENYGQNAASQEYQNAFQRYNTEYQNKFNNYQTQYGTGLNALQSVAGLGQTAVGQMNNASQNYANNSANAIGNNSSGVANALMSGANAAAGGITGAANAGASGLVGASNSIVNTMSQYLQQQQNQQWLNSLQKGS